MVVKIQILEGHGFRSYPLLKILKREGLGRAWLKGNLVIYGNTSILVMHKIRQVHGIANVEPVALLATGSLIFLFATATISACHISKY